MFPVSWYRWRRHVSGETRDLLALSSGLQGPKCKLPPRPPFSRTGFADAQMRRCADAIHCSEGPDGVPHQNQPGLPQLSSGQGLHSNNHFFVLGSPCIWLTESGKQASNWPTPPRSLDQPHRWIRPSRRAFLLTSFTIRQQSGQAHGELVLEYFDPIPCSLLPAS